MSRLVLTLRQPAQIGDRSREDFVLSTMEYLPGSVVRGAFAAAWIARNGVSRPGTSQRAEFLRLFEGGIRFGALLPDGAEDPSLSVVSHKYAALEKCREMEYDRALTDDVPSRCPDCESPLEQRAGLRGSRPSLHRRTSVAIHESGVARRGQLFTRETLPDQQSFTGTITADDPTLLDTIAGLGPVRVGGRRTTHGLADVALSSSSAPPPTAGLRGDGLLVLRLRSPGIFVDEQGRPGPEPTPSELGRLLGVPARVVRRWARWQQAGGWHIASGLPKPAELSVAAGSVFLISPERHIDSQTLTGLGQRGVGLRRHEGFGDLAPAPVLRRGRSDRERERDQRKRLMDAVAPLMGVPARWPQRWPALLEALAGHASGNPAATGTLRRIAAHPPDPGVGAALERFLDLPPQDARYVVEELRKL